MDIALTGDVMLGRMVDQYVIQNDRLLPTSLWGDVLPLLHTADVRLANLECVISDRGTRWRPLTKAFHFRAHPRAIDFLKVARIDCVTLANNHSLDYGVEALLDCLHRLDRAGIQHAGAGHNLSTAQAPAWLETAEGRIAVIALTDDMRLWAATADRPGLHYVAYNRQGLLEPHRSRLHQLIGTVRDQAQCLIVSAHVGPNWGKPSPAMRALARQLIDMGADLYWGHSNHTPQGIEVYQGKPILYATGDFVDDYMIDPEERNDRSFLFVVEVRQWRVYQIRLHPVTIQDLRVRRASGEEAHFVLERMRQRSAELGSVVNIQDSLGILCLD